MEWLIFMNISAKVIFERCVLKCTCTQKISFDMWKGHILEVHCTNIQLKIFTK